MGIEYQRVGGSGDDVFVDPFAEDTDHTGATATYSSYTAPLVALPSASSASSSASRPAPLPSSASSSSSTPHLNSTDIAAALSSGAMAGNAFGMDQLFEQTEEDTRYLHYERRSLWGQASYNIGYSYFGGLAGGGLVGFIAGLRRSPNNSPRVLLNSVLNGSGRFGARSGNALGMIALLYTVTERQLEDVEVDKLPGLLNNLLYPVTGGRDVFPRARADFLIPAATAFATGFLFNIPRAATMRGVEKAFVTLPKRIAVCVIGGIATTVGVGAVAVAGPAIFGERSPFRFA